MTDAIFVAVTLIIVLVCVLVIPNVLTKRAMRMVVKIFRDNNALSARTAKTIRDLKLQPRSFMMNMFMPRDYKPRALQYLMKANIVRSTDDGRVYLSQDTLRQYDLEKRSR
ncbi:MAG: hypothetical protein ABIB93_03210 [Chloroflexota bacterium]